MAEETQVTSGGVRPAAAAPASIAGRYLVRGVLGTGGFGAVYRAEDRITGEEVAVKIISGLSDPAEGRLRRELAALRWLQMPGVVRLRDDGPLDDGWFIVMDPIAGRPFPGGRTTWGELRPTVLALLETLERVHAAGVVHRDLKPANVLVDDDGRPTLLDFGIARGGAVARASHAAEFTLRYAAPEQVEGADGDERTDLYALGRMMAEALPDPAPVRQLIRKLTARDPARRPRDAAAVRRAIEGASRPLERTESWSEERLRGWFHGPDLFLHLREDAAAVLFARTGGSPARVEAELESWVARGLARRIDGRLALDRVAIDRLASETEAPFLEQPWFQRSAGERELRRLVTSGHLGPEVVPLALSAADDLRAEGRISRAIGVLDLGLASARASGVPEGPLLERWVLCALTEESIPVMDRALYELDRHPDADPRLATLLHAARAAYRREGERARALLEPLEVEGELDSWRQGMRVRAAEALGGDAERRLLDALDAWVAGDPRRRARLDTWRGNAAYRRGEWAEAARLKLGSAEHSRGPTRLARLSDAGDALLELFRFEEVLPIAAEIREGGARLRLPRWEAQGWALERAVAVRLRQGVPARLDAVEAASHLGPSMLGRMCLNEAALAWARSEPEVVRVVGERGTRALRGTGLDEVADVMEALVVAAGTRPPDPGVVERLAGRQTWRTPDFGVQVLGLLGYTAGPRADWLARALELARCRPAAEWRWPTDVISFEEALAMLGATAAARS